MSQIQQGVLITLIGMGLVFAVIIFLWGVMALLVRVTTNNKPEMIKAVAEREIVAEIATVEMQRQAVAAAVAMARAISDDHIRHPVLADTGDLSPWQSAHRARQLNPKNVRG